LCICHTGPWAVFKPMTWERQHCVDTNESQSAFGNQLGDRLIPSTPLLESKKQILRNGRPLFSLSQCIFPWSQRSQLKDCSIFSACSLVYRMHVKHVWVEGVQGKRVLLLHPISSKSL